jgi:hypothetical protein
VIKTKSLNLPLSTRLFFKIIFKVLQEVQIVLSQSIAEWRIAFSRLVALRFYTLPFPYLTVTLPKMFLCQAGNRIRDIAGGARLLDNYTTAANYSIF